MSTNDYTGELPSSLVGLWATEESVFSGFQIIGGTALYLDNDGFGAMGGAPLPVGRCEDGSVCTPIIGFRVRGNLDDDGMTLRLKIVEKGKSVPEITFSFDADKNILTGPNGSSRKERLLRRSSEIPKEIKAILHDI